MGVVLGDAGLVVAVVVVVVAMWVVGGVRRLLLIRRKRESQPRGLLSLILGVVDMLVDWRWARGSEGVGRVVVRVLMQVTQSAVMTSSRPTAI